MAQPALHFAIGASCGTLLSLAIGPIRRRWYRLGPLTAMLAGLWACQCMDDGRPPPLIAWLCLACGVLNLVCGMWPRRRTG